MKTLYFLLLGIFLHVSALSQTVTLRFEGAANSNNTNTRNYEVNLDGKKYYSSNANFIGTSRDKQILLTDLQLGSHQLSVYRITSNSTVSNSGTDAPVYSNSFQLREGYDMVIVIRRNEQVTFSEKRNTSTTGTGNIAKIPMTDTEFDKQLQSVKSKWSQTTRYTAMKTGFANKTYFYTTDQVGQLLLLITSETKRLELTKLAYPKVTDPNNFADVADLFNSQANKDNIEKFILSKNPASSESTNTGVNDPRPPITSQQFNLLLQRVRNQYEQSGKYAVLRDAFNASTDYFTTSQLRQLLSLISTESERLALAKLSYTRVSDASNFTSLYDLFNTQASRNELNNYIKYGETTASAGQYSNRIAMSDGEFSSLRLKASLHFRQSSVVTDVKEALTNTNNYFSLGQIRSLLSMIASEPDRLMLAKLAYHRATDPTAFTQLFDMFSSQANIDNLNNYIKTNRS